MINTTTQPGLYGSVKLEFDNFILDSGSFEIPASGLTAIFGCSGSGKTTFLRCLAGFESEVKGQVQFFNQAWLTQGKAVPIHKRGIGYVFQEPSLFVHLSVGDNLRYGLKRALRKRGGIAIEFNDVVEWLGLAKLLKRNTTTLSGGERQRVAIARALLSQPKIIMMDEPMASLDLFAKRAIIPYLERLRDELAIPILYISHSPEEVERLADTVIFMDKGRIKSIEPIVEALNRKDTPLYQSIEPRSVLSASVIKHDLEDGLSCLKVGGAQLWVPIVKHKIGDSVRIVIAAQQVSLLGDKPKQSSELNHLPITITAIEVVNKYSVLLHCRIANEPWPLLAQITKRSQKVLGISVGQGWIVAIKSASILN